MVKLTLEHNPNLNTIIMVEETINDSNQPITIAELKKKLPKKINHNTLKVILEYLENEGKISVSINGISRADNNKLLNEIKRIFKMETMTEITSSKEILEELPEETRRSIKKMSWERARELYKKVDEEGWKRVKYLTQAYS